MQEAGAFALPIELKWPNSVPISQLLKESETVFNKDLKEPIQILEKQWVETVGDLRLLIQEQQLRSIRIPIRLAVWIEEELSKLSSPAVTPSLDSKDIATRSYTFRYTADMDTNGLFYFLGSANKTKPWSNPAEAGLVEVKTSGMVRDSVPASSIVGRDVHRCVTTPEPNSWFSVDLVNKFFVPTHYTIRHYASWDTECLRHWRFEGSIDGVTFHVLRSHSDDCTLTQKGQAATWAISLDHLAHISPVELSSSSRFPPPLAFRAFRVIQTGPNSNNHHYLACSGFELYGVLHTQSPATLFQPVVTSLPTPTPLPTSTPQSALPVATPVDRKDSILTSDSHVYRPVSDFDENGIVYQLATRGRTQAWVNPVLQGLLEVTSSPLMQDSAPVLSAVGRECVRCVTRSQPDSWFLFDFGSITIAPTHYCLRHYSSWDAEALRSWKFEGSVNGVQWVLLREHVNDTALDKKGATHTWALPYSNSRAAYRMFKITQTGVNSNNHHYLAISGFDIYGAVFKRDGVTPFPIGASIAAMSQVSSAFFDFKHEQDFDTRGIIHFLGTTCGTQPWKNPDTTGILRVSASSLGSDSQPMSYVVGKEVVRCVTKSEQDSWIIVDLLDKVVLPTAYSLRHYSSWDTEALRSWLFQGSLDGVSWTTLREHVKDETLNGKGSTATWPISSSSYYRMFRIMQTGVNSNNHHYLACSGFELYGTLQLPASCPVASTHFPHLKQVMANLAFVAPSPTAAAAAAAVDQKALARPSSSTPSPPPSIFMTGKLRWDEVNKGQNLRILATGAIENAGSDNKWQMCRSAESFSSGRHYYTVKIMADKPTTNTWKFILGVLPSSQEVGGARQWVGTGKSWGYVAGTGGKCHTQAKSLPYGASFQEGDVIGIELAFDQGTIRFFKNGENQGLAWNNLDAGVPVHIAASMTATGSSLMFVDSKDFPRQLK